MKTYLDMDEILRHCRRYIGQEYDEPYLVSAIPEEVIRSLPPANVVEIRRGRWENLQGNKYHKRDMRILRCSLCRNFLDMSGVNAGRGNANYCPNCGAKMESKI